MHYTYIIYYIDSVYTYVVFVQIDKYIYTRVCGHVQTHRDVLETICITHRCWGLRPRQAGASWSESLFCFGHLNHPSEPPALSLRMPLPLNSGRLYEARQRLYCINE